MSAPSTPGLDVLNVPSRVDGPHPLRQTQRLLPAQHWRGKDNVPMLRAEEMTHRISRPVEVSYSERANASSHAQA